MKSRLMLATLAVPLANPVTADEAATTLDPVVITATRTPEPLSDTLAATSVIDRAEIERRQARSLPDLLRGLPGVTIAQSGGEGSAASVFLRGTNSDHVLVLVDGLEVGSATLGTPSLQDLPLAQIERIEVVRGPRSSLYGSEAIGGVIQIFTKRGGGAMTPSLSLGVGTLGTASVATSVSGGGDQGWFNLGASLERTDGINACDGSSVTFAGCYVEQNDRDGYRNLGFNLRAGYRFSEAAEVDLHLLRGEGRADFDGSIYAGNRSRSEQQVLGTSVTLRPLAPWTLKLSAGRSWDDYRAFYEDAATGEEVFVDSFETIRDTFSAQNDLTIRPGQILTLGVDYQQDQVSGSVDYDEDSRDDLGVFGQYQGHFGPAGLKLSLRQDDDQQFGTHTTGNAALGYRVSEGLEASLSYGTAFKAPSFNDLYYPGFGNPDLSPEQSHSLEVGLGGSLPLGRDGTARWGLNLYQTQIDDLIAFDSTTWLAANIESARIRGAEITGALQVANWRLAANLDLLDAENRSDDGHQGNLLPRRAEQSAQIDLDRDLGRWSLGTTLFVAGRRFDDLANSVRLDPYALLDLRAEYKLTSDWRAQVRLANLFDEEYETAYLYNQPGRALYLTVLYEPTTF